MCYFLHVAPRLKSGRSKQIGQEMQSFAACSLQKLTLRNRCFDYEMIKTDRLAHRSAHDWTRERI